MSIRQETYEVSRQRLIAYTINVLTSALVLVDNINLSDVSNAGSRPTRHKNRDCHGEECTVKQQ